MKNKHVKKNKRIAVRLSENELEDIRSHARHHNQSMSAFILSCVKSRPKIISMSPDNIRLIQEYLNEFVRALNDMHADYARALANLNHDNHMMNLGQLSTVPTQTLSEARNATIKNKQSLAKMAKNLHKLEMSIWK